MDEWLKIIFLTKIFFQFFFHVKKFYFGSDCFSKNLIFFLLFWQKMDSSGHFKGPQKHRFQSPKNFQDWTPGRRLGVGGNRPQTSKLGFFTNLKNSAIKLDNSNPCSNPEIFFWEILEIRQKKFQKDLFSNMISLN